jgi:hypothetical protein
MDCNHMPESTDVETPAAARDDDAAARFAKNLVRDAAGLESYGMLYG